jgi:hypothetical protein
MATDSLWFLDTLVTSRVAWAENADHISVLEHRVPAGDSQSLHVHHTEDEVICILEGRSACTWAGGPDARSWAGPAGAASNPRRFWSPVDQTSRYTTAIHRSPSCSTRAWW